MTVVACMDFALRRWRSVMGPSRADWSPARRDDPTEGLCDEGCGIRKACEGLCEQDLTERNGEWVGDGERARGGGLACRGTAVGACGG